MAGDRRVTKASNHTDHNSLGHFATRISVAMPTHIPGNHPKHPKVRQSKAGTEEGASENHENPKRASKPKSRMQALLETKLDEEMMREESEDQLPIDRKTTMKKKPSVLKNTQPIRETRSKTVHSSSHKNHSIESTRRTTIKSRETKIRTTKTQKNSVGLFGQKNLKVHTSEIRLVDKKNRKYVVDRSKLSLTSNQLQHGQIIAFWNAFMLFDHYETGVISASELSTTLNHLGLHTNEKELQAIIDAHDDNGNGALDFEEYLNLMTDPSIFQAMMHSGRPDQVENPTNHRSTTHKQHHNTNKPEGFHTPNKPDYRDCLMYEVMNEFFNCKSLGADQEREIVGFYAKTLKHIHSHKPHQQHAAHVVHHYADGARSLGLTEKEIKQEIDKIREKQRCEKNEKKRNSPYANPMRMIPRMDKSIEYKKKYDVMSKNNIKEGHLIWRGTPIVNYQVKLPRIEVACSKTFENLKKIRRKAFDENNNYRIGLSDVQKTNNKKLWSMLRYQHIPCERLKDVLKEVYGAYTTHVTMQPLDSKPRYVAYSIHDFKSVFPDLPSDSEDDEEFTMEQKRSTIHELSRQKLMMALKK